MPTDIVLRRADRLCLALQPDAKPPRVHRAPAYNAKIPNASARSRHANFNAIDFRLSGAGAPPDWARTRKARSADGVFSGWVRAYDRFVHINTRWDIG